MEQYPDFDDAMRRRGKVKRLKPDIEADILASFDLSDELVMLLCRCGFRQKEIPGLNMDLFKLHRRA